MSNDWRLLAGDPQVPRHPGYRSAVTWLQEFYTYSEQLHRYFALAVDGTTEYEKLPTNSSARKSAEQMISVLELQEVVLKRSKKSPPVKADSGKTSKASWMVDLQQRVEALGIKAVAHGVGVNRDTVTDILSGKTRRPRKKTFEKINSYLRRQKVPSSN